MKQVDPTVTRLRRLGLGGLPFDLAAPALLGALAFYLQDRGMLIVAALWATGVLVPAVVLRRAEIRVSDTGIAQDARLGRLGKWLALDWSLPLAGLKVEVLQNESTLPRFRPWQTIAFLHGDGESQQINRVLDWCRMSVPGDYMNRSSLAEAMRETDDPLPVLLRFPLLRALHDRDVPVRLLGTDEPPAEETVERQEAPRDASTRREDSPRAGTSVARDLNPLRQPAARMLLLAMVAALIYAVLDAVRVLDEGVANLDALLWLPAMGLVPVALFVLPLWSSTLARSVVAGVLLLAWAVFSLAAYPLLIRGAQALGEEPRMVDYRVMPGPVLEPLEEGWPVVRRFVLNRSYWESIPQETVYPLEMRRGPVNIWLVNVARVMRSQRADKAWQDSAE